MNATVEHVDWEAASQAAEALGINTRRLVALREPEAAIRWALEMSRQHTGVAALSYYELAVLLGHRDPKATAGARLDWTTLLRRAEQVAGAVRVKAAEEAKAIAEAKAAEEAAKAAEVEAEPKP